MLIPQELQLSPNLGAGAEFDLNSQWMINFEIKYQIISDFDQGVFNIGVAYKF